MEKLIASRQSQRQLKGYHVAAIMVAFFGVIMAVNITMAVIASKSWTGLVVKNSYVASAGFNDAVATAKAISDAGWHARFTYEDGIFTTRFLNETADMAEVGNAVLSIGRPAFEQADRTLEADVTDGVLVSKLDLDPGLWTIEVRTNISGMAYKQIARFYISESGKGTLQ